MTQYRIFPRLALLVQIAFVLNGFFLFAGTSAAAGPAPVSKNTDPLIVAMTEQPSSHGPPAPRQVASILDETFFAKDAAGFALAPFMPEAVSHCWHNAQSKGRKIPHQVYRPPRTTI